jgi:two-component system, OmpR family, alkaline phosphatase synthesis response regulator PhoP
VNEHNEPARILVVEDDASILLGLRMALQAEGYEAGTAEDGELGLAMARAEHWDLIILDIMLPKLNGFEFLGTIRAERIATPVLVLSARTGDVDKVMGLDLGAVDYVTKPFSLPELLARVRAALRRHDSVPPRWSFGNVAIDPETHEVRKDGQEIVLTATEFKVLATLVVAKGRALSREQIFEQVWGPSHHGTPRTIDNFMAQLRAKLEDDPTCPRHLLTVRGHGYRIAS